jgi:hypothetical protein
VGIAAKGNRTVTVQNPIISKNKGSDGGNYRR